MPDPIRETTDDRRCGDCWWCLGLMFLVGVGLYGSGAALVFMLTREAGHLAGWW
ncbi:hypothetical protein [Planktothrix phage Pra-JY27]|nr:hypothetical protein [Planktothrix phage Pag-Yong1]WEV89226.1 hypothetical protein [Synechococcus phage MinM2]